MNRPRSTPPPEADLVRISAEGMPQIPDHELIRPIGGGSYGEVWLARNALGAYRAVKVVRRATFDHDRPFDREFAGIQKFEPISRQHEGLVDLLQVGRNDAEGYFYYVMELADDANALVAADVRRLTSPGARVSPPAAASDGRSASGDSKRFLVGDGAAAGDSRGPRSEPPHVGCYEPRTLRSEIQRRSRVPLDECLTVALALTRALGYLHGQGLVHRDIKPSNIIYVGGTPKLADVGLVASVGEARSYVGTEGFIPPEGPGSPQADLYGLGILIYVMSTGKSHEDFPAPLPDLAAQADHARWLEFNAVIHKACRADPRERYQNAEEIHAELTLLQRGQSVRRKHSAERRLALARKLSMSAALLALLVTGVWLLVNRFNGSTVQRFNGSTGPLPIEVNSIAVLPLVNEGKSAGHEYLSDALTEETMNALTNCAGLRVAAQPAVFVFKRATNDLRTIGEKLGVRTVLAGTLLTSSNGMHLTARLINVADGAQLWSASFDHECEEFGALGTDVIQWAARALGLALEDAARDRARTNLLRKLAAYKLFAQALTNSSNTQDGLDRGIRLLNQAIAEDQSYAQAFAELAYRYGEASGFYLPRAQAMTAAKLNALRALELDDALPMAHRALATVFYRHEVALAKAEVHFRRAIEIAPNDGDNYGEYAMALAYFGRFKQADQVLKGGDQVDSKAHNLLGGRFWRYYLERDFQNARLGANRLLTLHSNSIAGLMLLAYAHEGLRQYDDAVVMAQRMTQMDRAPDSVALLGRIHARLGHSKEAQKALEELRVLSQPSRSTAPFSAQVLLGLGDHEHAIDHIERAVEEYPPTVLTLKMDPFWDDLRSDLRFQALLNNGGFEK